MYQQTKKRTNLSKFPNSFILKYYIVHFARWTSLRYVGKISEKNSWPPLDQILDLLLISLVTVDWTGGRGGSGKCSACFNINLKANLKCTSSSHSKLTICSVIGLCHLIKNKPKSFLLSMLCFSNCEIQLDGGLLNIYRKRVIKIGSMIRHMIRSCNHRSHSNQDSFAQLFLSLIIVFQVKPWLTMVQIESLVWVS